MAAESQRLAGVGTVSAGTGISSTKRRSCLQHTIRRPVMKTRFASAVVLLAAIGCLHAPTQSTAQALTRTAGADVPSTASTAPLYPVPRPLFAAVIARDGIGAPHRGL